MRNIKKIYNSDLGELRALTGDILNRIQDYCHLEESEDYHKLITHMRRLRIKIEDERERRFDLDILF